MKIGSIVTRIIIPVLAVIGLIFGIMITIQGRQHNPPAPPVVDPPTSPYKTFVAGAGLIEANTENIAIGTPVPGIVEQVLTTVGSEVKAGDALFIIDSRDQQAALRVQEASLETARQQLARAQALPRPEDVPPLEAEVRAAEAQLADLQNQYDVVSALKDNRAISREEVARRKYAVESQVARVAQVQAQLEELKAGVWDPDLEVLKSELLSAEARVAQVQSEIDRRTIRATVDGRILQVNVRPGEYAPGGSLDTPLMTLGNIHPLHIRVDVDENDAWRVRANAKATAFVRGNTSISSELKFVRIEPYVVPKRSLTGDSFERVDTRVLKVIYSFEAGELPIYVGQQMDVYIEAPPIRNDPPPTNTGHHRGQK